MVFLPISIWDDRHDITAGLEQPLMSFLVLSDTDLIQARYRSSVSSGIDWWYCLYCYRIFYRYSTATSKDPRIDY